MQLDVTPRGAGALFGVPAAELGSTACLLYTSDAADDLLCVDLGGRRIIKKKIHNNTHTQHIPSDDHNTLDTSVHDVHDQHLVSN